MAAIGSSCRFHNSIQAALPDPLIRPAPHPIASKQEIKDRIEPFREAGVTRLVVPYVPVSEPVIEDARRFVDTWGNA